MTRTLEDQDQLVAYAKLRSCPFCGSKPQWFERCSDGFGVRGADVTLVCVNSECPFAGKWVMATEGYDWDTRNRYPIDPRPQMIAAWNTRPAETALIRENTALREREAFAVEAARVLALENKALRASLQEFEDELPPDRCPDPNCGRRRADAALKQSE
jgi:hypothetical protein